MFRSWRQINGAFHPRSIRGVYSCNLFYEDGAIKMDMTTWALVGGIGFVISWALCGLYWSSPQFQLKKTAPKTIDIELFKKYNVKRGIEVDDNEISMIHRYTSTGLIQTGLNKNSKLTVRLTERGRALL